MRRIWLVGLVAGGLAVAVRGQPTEMTPLRTIALEQGRAGPQVQFSADSKRVSVLTPTAVVTSPLVVGGTAKNLIVKKGPGTAFMISKRLPDAAVPRSLLAEHPNVHVHDHRPGIGKVEAEMH